MKDLNDSKIWKDEGDIHFNKGEFESAVNCYDHAIELNSNYIEALNNLGLSLLKLGKIEEAKEVTKKIKQLKRLSPKTTLQDDVIPQKKESFCPNCGAILKFSNAEICPTCGVRIKNPEGHKFLETPLHYETNYLLIGLFFSFFISFFFGIYASFIAFFIVIVSSFVVYIDAQTIGAGSKNASSGWGSSKPWHWALITLLIWIIGLPLYIIKRRQIFDENN